MRVGLLSDTHIPDVAKKLPAELIEAFQGVDLILHAGDLYTPSVLDDLERIAPVLAAMGDDDHEYGDNLTDKRMKEMHILKLEGQTLWLVHIQPYHLTSKRGQRSLPSGQESGPDIVVFGHEHYPLAKRVDDILYVCPGSPTFLHYKRGLGTVGILDIDSNEADARILQL
jgi:putative phosphoesterase